MKPGSHVQISGVGHKGAVKLPPWHDEVSCDLVPLEARIVVRDAIERALYAVEGFFQLCGAAFIRRVSRAVDRHPERPRCVKIALGIIGHRGYRNDTPGLVLICVRPSSAAAGKGNKQAKRRYEAGSFATLVARHFLRICKHPSPEFFIAPEGSRWQAIDRALYRVVGLVQLGNAIRIRCIAVDCERPPQQ